MYKSLKTKAFLLLALVAMLSALVSAEDPTNTYQKSVVLIKSVFQDFDYSTPWKQTAMASGVGSGFVVSDNAILTNAHNVSNTKYVELKKQGLPQRYLAYVTYVGHDCDLALITTQDPAFFADTVPLELGPIPAANSTVRTYGFPMGGRHISVTEGVVSRIQMDLYSHTRADTHLVVQTDAAINPGNSGGPVMQDGKVVGVAFQGLRAADNIGYMIPTTVIQHFLDDTADGVYDGFGSLGFSFFPALHSESYCRYLNLPPGQQGVVVLNTMLNSSIEDIFKAEDVITKFDDYDIDNDAMVNVYGLALHMSEITEQKQIGDTIDITYYRDGEERTVTAAIAANRPPLPYWRQFDTKPRYYLYAGLTFVPLSRNFLETWGKDWAAEIPFRLKYLFANSAQLNESKERTEYVVLSEILPDEVNSYSTRHLNSVVETVNGVAINSLADLKAAFEDNEDPFCKIKFMFSETPLILDSEEAFVRTPEIMNKYNVPAKASLEN
ncbi:MAG: serine protease [Planctomycetes bacterium]|nr:serine protease [Planctomycetota bacterium]